jgi:carboxylesterase type B
VNAIFGPANVNGNAPASYQEGGVNNAIVPVAQAYWTSFIRSRNPNTHRLPGTPTWEQWTEERSAEKRLMFRTNATEMEEVGEGQERRCEYLLGIGLKLKQ